VIGAVAAALMILALTANVAAADEGIDSVPYDPGLPSESPTPPATSWPFTE